MSRIRRVYAPEAPEPPPETWSNCLVVDGIAYVSGLTGRAPDGAVRDDYQQAHAIFDKMRGLLEAAGGTMADVVKMTVYVTEIRRREDIWRARQEFFAGDFPASSLVEVSKLATPETTVEIEAVAHIGAPDAPAAIGAQQ